MYIRVAKTSGRRGYKVSASTVPNVSPIAEMKLGSAVAYPTIAFAVEIDLPDELFTQAERVIASIKLTEKDAKIAAVIAAPKDINEKSK
ncbi:hypothetical protein [Rhodopseudomonas palustris]|uniref:hypothetical protein n=1 Tax=Rhodopseudomonas palustris TaxID=1076 RepID=UPI00131C901C|nr:hypothetical protein [Rhodopseudomonas palustris]